MLQNEEDRRIKQIWELHLNMEIGQLQAACDLLQRYEGVDPLEILPPALPDTPVTFEPNKQYVRDILASQYTLRTDGFEYVPVDELPEQHRFFTFQATVNGGSPPSEMVIDEERSEHDVDYRDETEGANPIAELQQLKAS
jgi:hypothetical protein